MYEEIFEDLKINSNSKFQTRATMSHKSFKSFGKLRKMLSFNS